MTKLLKLIKKTRGDNIHSKLMKLLSVDFRHCCAFGSVKKDILQAGIFELDSCWFNKIVMKVNIGRIVRLSG